MGGRTFKYTLGGAASDPRTFGVGDHVWLVSWDRAQPWYDYDLEDALIVHAVIREIDERETTMRNGTMISSFFHITFENDEENWGTFEYRANDGWSGIYMARSEDEAIESVRSAYAVSMEELAKELQVLQAKYDHCRERQIKTVEGDELSFLC